MDDEPTKICIRCRRTLPLSSFYVARGNSDGHANSCRWCCVAQKAVADAAKRKRIIAANANVVLTDQATAALLVPVFRQLDDMKKRRTA